jgi:hypothetical protein
MKLRRYSDHAALVRMDREKHSKRTVVQYLPLPSVQCSVSTAHLSWCLLFMQVYSIMLYANGLSKAPSSLPYCTSMGASQIVGLLTSYQAPEITRDHTTNERSLVLWTYSALLSLVKTLRATNGNMAHFVR